MEPVAPGNTISVGEAYTWDCPRCGTKSASVVTARNIDAGLADQFTPMTCGVCKRESAVHLERVPGSTDRFIVLSIYPFANEGTGELQAVPSTIEAALQEALTCRAAGALTAGALVCRRTIELVAQEEKAQGSNLAEKIDDLHISDGLKTIAHTARLMGNDAAHLDGDLWSAVTGDDLDELIDLTTALLRQVYDEPFRIEALARRVKKIHDGVSGEEE